MAVSWLICFGGLCCLPMCVYYRHIVGNARGFLIILHKAYNFMICNEINLKRIYKVRPILQHLAALIDEFGVKVRRICLIIFGMGKLRLDVLMLISHL